jgi:hypothetical protein
MQQTITGTAFKRLSANAPLYLSTYMPKKCKGLITIDAAQNQNLLRIYRACGKV